ncbi:hypothetical protein PRVXT_002492 [Proteinivorax tanatarense]|uniref:TRAM domain-containing protein n=1 Tax=Proteinivorax tanatarense TaxID=1260629 RepID=A0AAU7VKG5_9FIRM
MKKTRNSNKNYNNKKRGHKPSLKKETIEANCIDYDSEGKGIISYNNQQIPIPNLLKGETAKIEIIKKGKFIIGKILKVIKPSPKRIKAKCKHYEKCGGCQLQHISYDDQAQLKQSLVERLMNPLAKQTLSLRWTTPMTIATKYTLHTPTKTKR